MATAGELAATWTGATGPPAWETVLGDGIALRHEVGLGGDHRFSYGKDTFHISPDARTVLCAVDHPDDVRWQRQLLDTILFSVSFLNGFELLHASAVEADDGVLGFVAGTGGGKSTLAAELGRRGYRIFADDVLAIGQHGPDLLCHPGPAVMTVPSSSGLGTGAIAEFTDEDELWVELDDVSASPRALSAVYLLDRFADHCCFTKLAAPTVLDLLPHSISLPHDAERARSRFDLFSTLAEQIEMFRLAADSSTNATTIADLVEGSFQGLGSGLVVT